VPIVAVMPDNIPGAAIIGVGWTNSPTVSIATIIRRCITVGIRSVPSVISRGIAAVIRRGIAAIATIAAVISRIAAVITVARVTIGAGGQAADYRTGDEAARESATPTPATPGFGWRRRRYRT
jgi:hypothetical protein